MKRFSVRQFLLFLSILFLHSLLGSPLTTLARNHPVGGGPGGGFGGGGPGGGGPGGGGPGGAAGGIIIDANGVVKSFFQKGRSTPLLKKKQVAFAKKNFSTDLVAKSSLRKISLVRLEKEIQKQLAAGKKLTNEVKYLAGLQRIDFVFVYPDKKDIVIAGLAEGFAPDPFGRAVGIYSGRPTIQLDDLLVALRALQKGDKIGCSIDPKKERLAALEKYIKYNSNPSSTAVAQRRYFEMAQVLGMQDIKTWGVPKDSHFALTLVEADLLMKRISMGLDPSHVRKFRTHLSMLGRRGNSIQRWWFSPLYKPFQTTNDKTVFQFNGQRAQLLSQEEVTQMGNRSNASTTRLSTVKYAKLFTKRFPKLAKKNATFADLQNLIDLSVLAALFKQEGLPEKVAWKMELFLDNEKLVVQKYNVPREVHSIFSYKMSGRSMVTGLVGGGVVLHPYQTLRALEQNPEQAKGLQEKHNAASQKETSNKHPWWWD
ncbi:hypothetical protein MNBD_PLANCTO02-2125 [hydrothermal vent metagenome]|uniref:DUF1598 domain-containing protein n=1 Tax=hydrothermal vent metagenome TaxID=652676 RepID=A0A3B1D5Q5_9ZZZZ